MKKSNLLVLSAVFISFLALGMPDGAFGVAWPSIRYEMGLGLDMAFILVVTHSVFYGLSGWGMGWLARVVKLPNVNIIGLFMILTGISGFSLSPSLIFLVLSTMILGLGMGFVDGGLNAYAAKHFESRHMNWLHCFWGLGGAISPIIMSQMIILIGWRAGYISVLTLQGIMTAFVLFTLLKGVWIMSNEETEEAAAGQVGQKFLTQKRYAAMQVAIFFFYAAFEYAVTFWTVSLLLESRGMDIGRAGLYPAVYLGSMTVARFIMGYAAKWVSNTNLSRFGLLLSILGLVILTVSNNIIGMAFIGFGFGPVFPCLMHETARRYSPEATTKLVGYQIAAVGAGVGLSTFTMGRLFTIFSLELLFPAVIGGMIIVGLLNEVIEHAMRKLESSAA